MTRIRANCPECGEVDLLPDDLRVVVVRAATGEVTAGSRYHFACPDCEQRVTKPADARTVDLLRGGGVPVEPIADDDLSGAWPLLFPGHPEAPPGGPPLTHDDLLAMHLLLERDDWYEQLAAG